MKHRVAPVLALTASALLGFDPAAAAQKQHPLRLPTPHLVYRGSESYEANGFDFERYQYDVTNKAKYPKALFATSPALPPCGESATPSRATVEIFDQAGKRLVEFCSLAGPEHLGPLWFAVPSDKSPPSAVYIKITDRLTGGTAQSNVAPTSKPG